MTDTERLEWLHSEFKVTISYALQWPCVPQDMDSFRTRLDATMDDRRVPQDGSSNGS